VPCVMRAPGPDLRPDSVALVFGAGDGSAQWNYQTKLRNRRRHYPQNNFNATCTLIRFSGAQSIHRHLDSNQISNQKKLADPPPSPFLLFRLNLQL